MGPAARALSIAAVLRRRPAGPPPENAIFPPAEPSVSAVYGVCGRHWPWARYQLLRSARRRRNTSFGVASSPTEPTMPRACAVGSKAMVARPSSRQTRPSRPPLPSVVMVWQAPDPRVTPAGSIEIEGCAGGDLRVPHRVTSQLPVRNRLLTARNISESMCPPIKGAQHDETDDDRLRGRKSGRFCAYVSSGRSESSAGCQGSRSKPTKGILQVSAVGSSCSGGY